MWRRRRTCRWCCATNKPPACARFICSCSRELGNTPQICGAPPEGLGARMRPRRGAAAGQAPSTGRSSGTVALIGPTMSQAPPRVAQPHLRRIRPRRTGHATPVVHASRAAARRPLVAHRSVCGGPHGPRLRTASHARAAAGAIPCRPEAQPCPRAAGARRALSCLL